MKDLELTDTTTLTLEPQKEGVRVTVTEHLKEPKPIYSMVVAKDFYDSQQKRGTIANALKKKATNNPEEVAEAFRDTCMLISANTLDEDREKMFRSPIVQELLNQTEAVEVYGSENTTISVRMTVDDMTRELSFTAAQWANGGPGDLREMYYNEFYTRIDVSKDEWEELVEGWEKQRVIVEREALTEWDVILAGVQDRLGAVVEPHLDKDKFKNDKKTAWYEEGEEPTLWVSSTLVAEQLEEQGKDKSHLSELSKKLREEGVTRRSTKKVCGIRSYAFVPTQLAITRGKVFSSDDEGPGVEP